VMMTSRQVTLSSRLTCGTRIRITLIDITGRIVAEWDRTMTRTMQLQTKTVFPKGIYFLRLQDSDLDIVIKTICIK